MKKDTLIKRNQSGRQGTEVSGEHHRTCSSVAAGAWTSFQDKVIVVRSNAAREAELDSTASLNHLILFLLLQVVLEKPIFFSLCMGLLKLQVSCAKTMNQRSFKTEVELL